MKKITFFLLLALAVLLVLLALHYATPNTQKKATTQETQRNGAAQEAQHKGAAQDAQHITFLGKELCGDIDSFREHLKSKGYKEAGYDDDAYIFTGSFAGRDCYLWLLNHKGIAWRAAVMFDKEYSDWTTLQKDYTQLRDYYVQKYGTPATETHEFADDYRKENPSITAVRFGEYTWQDEFAAPGGEIMLQISHEPEVSIVIIYMDAEGDAKRNADIMDEI